jgi:hypothetical protein
MEIAAYDRVGEGSNAMEQSPDSTEVDPAGHKVVFENDHVRVLSAHMIAEVHAIEVEIKSAR